MRFCSRFGRRFKFLGVLIIALLAVVTAFGAGTPEGVPLLRLLGRSIEWYHQVQAMDVTPGNSHELVLRTSARLHAQVAIQLEFKFAQAQAAIVGSSTKNALPATSPAARVQTALQNAANRLIQAQAQLKDVDARLQTATGQSHDELLAMHDKLNAQINLATAERNTLTEYAKFLTSTDTGQGASLADKVATLMQSVPELQEKQASETPANDSQSVFNVDTAGVFTLISQAFALNNRRDRLIELTKLASDLETQAQALRQPLRTATIDAVHLGDAIASTQPSHAPAEVEAQGRKINELAERFHQLTAASIPLAEAATALDASHQNLADWQALVTTQYTAVIRALTFRLGGMIATIIVIIIISELWRRATFRYIHDVRRRRQLMLVRRIVVGFIIFLIIVATLATEISSLATFAGLITAGIAVALQTVILSGVAYFFFIGRFGVRVGDRITIGGVTGDVVEIGLFRLYLMELKGDATDLHPTGRIVVFSNAVLFQPSAFFKQLPGADYIWHEQSFTLNTETDYRQAEQKMLSVVNDVYQTYKGTIEEQHAAVSGSIHVSVDKPHPEARVRFVGNGVELLIRYPVEIKRASEIDDQITRKVLATISADPSLKGLKPSSLKT